MRSGRLLSILLFLQVQRRVTARELAKRLVKDLKDSKLKVQMSIQGDELRVSGKKKDDLQDAIAWIRAQKIEYPLQFVNFRD